MKIHFSFVDDVQIIPWKRGFWYVAGLKEIRQISFFQDEAMDVQLGRRNCLISMSRAESIWITSTIYRAAPF